MIISEIEAEYIAKAQSARPVPDFSAGDHVAVHVRIKEGTRERIQIYEGTVIARRNRGMGSSFTVRKVSFGEGVERVFPLYSPVVSKIVVLRHGIVRRSKLYYLRNLRGKKARIETKREDKARPLKTPVEAS